MLIILMYISQSCRVPLIIVTAIFLRKKEKESESELGLIMRLEGKIDH